MRKIAALLCPFLFLASVGVIRADDDAKLREVVAKAIKAHGGADNLKKYQAFVAKAKGTFHGMETPLEYTSETSVQLPDRVRTDIESKIGDTSFMFSQVVNGDKGWFKLGDNTDEMNKDMLEEAREQLNVMNVTHLSPLMDKKYVLTSLGELKVGDKPAIGIRVARKDYRDISLFFDKKDGFLIKTETRGKDTMRGGEEFTSETFYNDYKKVDGIMVAYKVTIKRDGKPYVESEIHDVKVSEKLDNSLFDKP